MIKLIVTDIDGTLIQNSTSELYPEILGEIERLTGGGVLFACASGRQCASMAFVFKGVEDRILYIAENGAHVRYRGRDIAMTQMRRDYAEELIAQLRQIPGCEILVSTPEGSLLETKNPQFINLISNGYHNNYRIVEDVLKEKGPMLKISIYHPGSIRELGESKLIPAWKNRLKACMAGDEWVDFMDLSVDKGSALQAVQSLYGITKSETMAFGDDANDIGLMQAASESYAVENAHRDVKEAARYVCPSWKDKGVWQIIRKINRVEHRAGLTATFFGNFRLTLNGKEITLDNSTSSKPMQLLEMLLHAGQEGVIREKLQEALYGKGKVTDKTNNMKQTVFRLRKMLEESDLPPASYIVIKKSYYYWNSELILDTDTGRFCKSLELAESERETKQKLRYLMDACSVYRGEFLQRLPADSWAGEERRSYKERYYKALRELCTILKQEGRYEDMLQLCMNAQQIYPHEEWELECLDCLIALERFQEAQLFYQKTSDYYTDKMHNDLSDELKERHSMLRDRVRNASGKIEDIQTELSQTAQNIHGTYYCSYPNFEGICIHMIRNTREDEGQATLLLCTMLDEKKGVPLSPRKLKTLSDKLESAIRRNLRKSDCFTRYSDNQFLILLVNCDLINSVYAQKRISYYLEKEYGVRTGVRYDTATLR